MTRIVVTGTPDFNNYCFIYRHLKPLMTPDTVLIMDLSEPIDIVFNTFARLNDIPVEYELGRTKEVFDSMLNTSDKMMCFWDGKSPETATAMILANDQKKELEVVKFLPSDMLVSSPYTVHCKQDPHYDVYIGRPSKWENPYKLKSESYRLECICEFAHYLLNKSSLLNQIDQLQGKILGCWCGKKLCHGAVYRYLLQLNVPTNPDEVIDSFHGENYFLSNFNPAIITFDGIVYPTSEHAYQAAKTFDQNDRLKISQANSPKIAKHLGYKVTIRSDWEKIKRKVMREILQLKFQDQLLQQKLLNTGSKILIEGNKWHDNYYGNCNCDKCKDIVGKNVLGKELMALRVKLRKALKDQKYIDRLIVPIDQQDIPLFTSSGLQIATAYNRIVVGDRGPYVEFTTEQINHSSMVVPNDQKWRLTNNNCYYNWYTSIDDTGIKIYEQCKTVSYADYLIGLYYISPFELYTETGEVLISGLTKKRFKRNN